MWWVYDLIRFLIQQDKQTAQEARALAQEIDDAVERVAVLNHPVSGKIYAFEVDGFGSAYFMDDANIPSLLSFPYLGYTKKNDPLYQATRKFILSENNPYFFKVGVSGRYEEQGESGEGVGGPHVGPGYIWPMSIIMRAYTSDVVELIGMIICRIRMKLWNASNC